MRIMKIATALWVSAAFAAVLASGASAAASTTAANWYTGTTAGGTTQLSGSQSVTMQQSGTGTFMTVVSGSEVIIHWTGIECVGCSISNSPAAGGGSGQLKFTGVTVEKPAKCSTVSAITTKALTYSADWMDGSNLYVRLTPTAGAATEVMRFELTGCAFGGVVVIPKGYFWGWQLNGTGVMATSKTLEFGTDIDLAAGASLKIGTESAGFDMSEELAAGGKFFGEK